MKKIRTWHIMICFASMLLLAASFVNGCAEVTSTTTTTSSSTSSSATTSSTSSSSSSTSTTTTTTTTTTTIIMGGAIQGVPLNLSDVVTTLAGLAGNTGETNATGTSARFYNPYGLTTDGDNLYIADTGNHTIRKIVISSGVVTTFAGSAGTSGSTDGTGSAARFKTPYGITTDGTNLYVADSGNYTIRKIVISSGVVTTLAGSVGNSGSTDGNGTSAKFATVISLTTDGTNIFVADAENNTIRKIVISTADVTTMLGSAGASGSTDATGSAARFNTPYGITTDGTNLFISDTGNHTIRQAVITTEVVTTLAGSAGNSGSADGSPATARFYNPVGITSDGTNLFVADTTNNTIRKVVKASGVVSTTAGSAGNTGSSDGTGSAARFFTPYGITAGIGSVYVADTGNSTIRKID